MNKSMSETLTGLEKEKTLQALCNKRRLPLPKGGPVHCPVEYYNIMLQCWHRIPECRLTFKFLGGCLYDFNVSVETDNLLTGTVINISYIVNKIS